MKSFAVLAAFLSVAPFALAQQQLMINSLQGVVECEPVMITWTGGAPPYYLSFIPAGNPAAAAIKQFPAQSGTSFTWKVDLPAGTSFSSELKDASGQSVFSGTQNIESGTDKSCLNAGTTGSVSAIDSASTISPTSATTPVPAAATDGAAKVIETSSTMSSGSHSTSTASASGVGTTAAHVASSGSATATSSGATTASTQNAASRETSVGAIGIAGLLGLVGAALF